LAEFLRLVVLKEAYAVSLSALKAGMHQNHKQVVAELQKQMTLTAVGEMSHAVLLGNDGFQKDESQRLCLKQNLQHEFLVIGAVMSSPKQRQLLHQNHDPHDDRHQQNLAHKHAHELHHKQRMLMYSHHKTHQTP